MRNEFCLELTGILVTTVPIWMALVELFRKEPVVPRIQMIFGLTLGFGGVILLVGPGNLAGNGGLDPLWASVLILASLSWAIGSVYSQKAPFADQPTARFRHGNADRKSRPSCRFSNLR